MPALAALSAMVSNTLRGALVSRSNCSMRASISSSAGTTQSVAFSTSTSVAFGPFSGRARMNANSTSRRGTMKRAVSTSPPSRSTMLSSSRP